MTPPSAPTDPLGRTARSPIFGGSGSSATVKSRPRSWHMFTGLHLSLENQKRKNKVYPLRGVLAGALRKVTLEPYGRGGPFQALPPEKPLIKGVDPGGNSRHDFPRQCSNPIAKSAIFALSRALPPGPTPRKQAFPPPSRNPRKSS